MSVLNDYECKMHGVFEAFERKCPHGCSRSIVQQVFLKAPGTRSIKTKYIDHELKSMARDYNLPDIRNDKDGTSTMTKLGRTGKAVDWVDIPHAGPGKDPVKFDIDSLTKGPNTGPGFQPGQFGMPMPQLVGGRR